MAVAEHRRNEMQPKKKKTSQNPQTRYKIIYTIIVGVRVIIGKAILSGNVNSPKEYRWITPIIIAPIAALTKIA